MQIRVDDLKITLILQKGKFSLILLFTRVLKSSDNLPRNGKTITKSFFSSVNVTGFSVSLLLRKFLMQLSINMTRIAFYLIFFLNDILVNEILKNPKQLKMFKIIKLKSNQLYILPK